MACTASCSLLDTVPEGGAVTLDEDNITNDQLRGLVIGMYDELTGALNTFGSTDHTDYGIPSMHLRFDSDGMDVVSKKLGYNQFSSTLTYTDHMYDAGGTLFIWYRNYQIIRKANDILKLIDANAEDATRKSYIAEAKTLRAYAYLNLAQSYQFTYVGNEKKACVPILDETMSFQDGNNNPRATVEKVYSFILADLDDAIAKFDVVKGQVGRRDKMTVNADVAHGLRARTRLVMHDYKGAMTDAEAVLAAGYTPYTKAEASQPNFINVNDHNFVWGLVYNENSYAVMTGIINWASHLCSFCANGYTTGGGVYRMINTNLFNRISPSDVRYGWWLDGASYSPNLESNQAYLDFVEAQKVEPYATIKFAPANKDVNSTNNTQHYPMMRAEEMELIRIECMAHESLTSAKQALTEFVSTYRDDSYQCYAQTLDDFIDEVWFQRRVELWGEGFAYFDIMRLHKDIDRSNSNFENDYQWVIKADSPILLFRIPSAEISANNAISDEANNPVAPLPSI